MKIIAISIERFEARRRHIVAELGRKTSLPWEVVGIDAIDMRAAQTDWPHNPKLRDSEVGCASSHAEACRRIVEQDIDAALIVEDDVVLPEDIDEILADLRAQLRKKEVIALYNRTILPEKFSTRDAAPVGERQLIYPMETRFMRTAAAYFIDRHAAAAIAEFNSPVRVVADDWAAYYRASVIDHIRLLHPIPVRLHPFASTLATDRGSPRVRAATRILSHALGFDRLRAVRRQAIQKRREANVVLVNLPSDQMRNA